MKIHIARYYGQERLELDCEVLTPMFLGGASQDAELRAAPFKGLLRYWWRVLRGRDFSSHKDLLAEENRLFGSADEKTGGKSRVTVQVAPLDGMKATKEGLGNPGNVEHPECERTRGQTNPLNYLAGMGLIHYRNGILHSYFPVGARFRLTVTATQNEAGEVSRAMALFARFAAIGSRSRNGWGCFAASGAPSFHPEPAAWQEALERDYPHCLGRDGRGLLLWKTRKARPDWKQCMRDLAETYIKVRTELDVVAGRPPDRHLLGYPVTNHPYPGNNWGNQGRHASALRLLVRREGENLRGYFLHLPHAFSKRMWPDDRQRQIEIWQKVHNKLDALCNRVPEGEV